MKTRITALDGLRGYAVVLVFFVHFWGSYASKLAATSGVAVLEKFDFGFQAPLPSNLYFYLSHSHYGVDIFFVLSGFLIASILQSPSARLDKFLLNRLWRIYPAFLLSTIAALAMWYFLLRQPIEATVVLKNLFFLNGILFLQIPAINGVTWSLFYEVSFYTFMAALVFIVDRAILQRPLGLLFIGLFVTTALVLLFGTYRGGMSLGLFFHLFVGATIASANVKSPKWQRAVQQLPTWQLLLIWLTYTTLFSTGLISYPDWYYYPVSALSTGLLLAKIVCSNGPLTKIFQWRPMVSLGRISYSFYLFHAIVISVVFNTFLSQANWLSLLTITFLSSTAVAILSYLIAERPYFAGRRA